MTRARTIALSISSLLVVAAIAGYLMATRVTALMAVRFAIRQAGAPVSVSGARWEWRWQDLRQGKIKFISFTGDVAGRLAFDVESEALVRRDGETWVLAFRPTLRLGTEVVGAPVALPPLSGPMGVRIDPGKGFSATFDFTAGPYELQRPEGGLALKSAALRGSIDIHGASLQASMRIAASGVQGLWGARFLEKPKLDGEVAVAADLSKNPVPVRITKLTLKAPWRAKGDFAFGDGPLRGGVEGSFDAADFLVDAATLFPEAAGFLQGASAKGRIKYAVRAEGGAVNGSVAADLASLILPSKSLSLAGVKFEHRLGGRGRLDVAMASFGPLALPLGTHVLLAEASETITLQTASPLMVEGTGPMAGASLEVGPLQLNLPKKDGGQVAASGRLSGTVPIAALQKTFCLAADRHLPGLVRVGYDPIVYDANGLSATGRAEGALFGGWARVGDVKLSLKGHTEIETEAFLENADIKFLAEWLRFGKVTGRLDMTLKNAAFVLSALGTIPVRYDFAVRGSSDKGRNLNFSSQALTNLMDMMGVDTPVLSMQMGTRKFFSDIFGFINDIDYFGFHARTQLGYTTLETFDPPGAKNHYLIHGTSFKMPLKSSMGGDGIYPVVMKTESFQTWLWSRANWFKNRSKERSDDQNGEKTPECVAAW